MGSFVNTTAAATPFQVTPRQHSTLRDVIDLLELRMGVETEAASLAALRRTPENLAHLNQAMADFIQAVDSGGNAVDADFAFHSEIARATLNPHYARLLDSLGARVIPRARLGGAARHR